MDLQKQMSREYSAAKCYWIVLVMLQMGLLACSVAYVWVASRRAVLFLGGVAFAVPVLTLILKRLASRRYSGGERLRRLLVLENGLGQEPDRVEVLMAAADSTVLPTSGPEPIGSYFDSDLPHGYRRLAQITEESAFYTRRLARVTALGSGLLAGLGAATAVAVLWWAVQQPASLGAPGAQWQTWGERAARLFVEVFGFFAAGLFTELALDFSELAMAAEVVFEKCAEVQRERKIDPAKVFWHLGSYDSALAKAPPLPDFIKRLFGPSLARAWAAHKTSDTRKH